MNAHIEAVNDGNFQFAVLESKQPVLVDFWAPWYGPCRALGPIMESVSKAYSEVARVAKLNVDDNPVVTARYGIRAIPTLIVFTDGEEKERLIGAVSQDEIKRNLDKHLEAPLN
jgi:thioredoxin 1